MGRDATTPSPFPSAEKSVMVQGGVGRSSEEAEARRMARRGRRRDGSKEGTEEVASSRGSKGGGEDQKKGREWVGML